MKKKPDITSPEHIEVPTEWLHETIMAFFSEGLHAVGARINPLPLCERKKIALLMMCLQYIASETPKILEAEIHKFGTVVGGRGEAEKN